jgi:chromosome segregation protein
MICRPSADTGAPLHWRELGSDASAPSLPFGARPLSEFVTGSAALLRRLSQVGVLDNEAGCRALAGQLQQGQRLVGRDGSMWRWDGYTVQAGSPTPGVQRLEQRNRLKDLNAKMDGVAADLSRAHAEYDLAKAALSQPRPTSSRSARSLQAAYNTARDARETLTRAEQALEPGQRQADRASCSADHVRDRHQRRPSSSWAHRRGDRRACPTSANRAPASVELKPILTDRRGRLIECRSTDERLRREAQQRQSAWTRSSARSPPGPSGPKPPRAHLDALTQRREAMEAEIARLAALPEAAGAAAQPAAQPAVRTPSRRGATAPTSCRRRRTPSPTPTRR